VPGLVVIGLVVSVISSLGAPLIPAVAETNHVSLASAQWSLTIALLAGAVLTPVTGRLGDGPHRRRVVLGALGAVFVGSLLAALPLGFAALLVGRAMQGAGLGLIPLVIAIARDHVPADRSRQAIALLSVTAVAGVGLGYPLTGVVADRWGLHGAFWFGAAASGVAFLIGFLCVPASTHRARRRLDAWGAVLLGAGFALLLLGLAEAETWGWTSTRLVAVLMAALVVLVAAVFKALRSDHPIVELRLLRRRGVLVTNLCALLQSVGMYLVLALIVRIAQTPTSTGYGLGASVAEAGLILLPLSVASLLSSRVLTLLVRRGVQLTTMLPVGTVMMGLALVFFSLRRDSLLELSLMMAVFGLGSGVSASVMPALILQSVPSEETGSATAFNQVLRTAGLSIGSALSGTLLAAYTPAGQALPTAQGYQVGGYVGIAMAVITLAVVVPLLPRSPRVVAADPVQVEVLGQESVADGLSESDQDELGRDAIPATGRTYAPSRDSGLVTRHTRAISRHAAARSR
jgi:predicted MFS family arabinose efflux permease